MGLRSLSHVAQYLFLSLSLYHSWLGFCCYPFCCYHTGGQRHRAQGGHAHFQDFSQCHSLEPEKMGSGSDPTTFTKAASPWLAEQIYHPHHLYNFEPVSAATTWEKQVQKRETNINFSYCLIWLSDFYSPLLAIQFSFAVPQFLLFVRKALKIECYDLLFNVALYWRKNWRPCQSGDGEPSCLLPLSQSCESCVLHTYDVELFLFSEDKSRNGHGKHFFAKKYEEGWQIDNYPQRKIKRKPDVWTSWFRLPPASPPSLLHQSQREQTL